MSTVIMSTVIMGTYQPQDYIIYIAILYIILWLFLKYFFTRIKFDRRFLYSILPFIPLGIFIRVAADTGIFERSQLWNVTPGVYILCVVIFIISFLAGLGLKRISKTEVDPFHVPTIIGSILSVYMLYLLLPKIIYPERILFPLILTGSITFFLYLLFNFSEFSMFRKTDNLSILFAHLLDGSATFIAYNYFNFYEEHILPNILISMAGDNAIIMIPLKLAVALLVIYVLEKYQQEDTENEQLYTVLKFIIFAIGIGPGIRNTLLPSLI